MSEDHPPPTEEVVAKYKRLLSLARTSLEANQATLATKDQQIQQLLAALEEEKNKNSKKVVVRDDDITNVPRKILSRVQVYGTIWVLLEYEHDDSWKSFNDEQSLHDFIQRIPGVPLDCPPQCLSVEESLRITEDAKRRIERIVEEFRRYKVRTEIAKKQKHVEIKQQHASIVGVTAANAAASPLDPSHRPTNLLPSSLEKALTQGMHTSGDPTSNLSEVQSLRKLLHEQEIKAKDAYDSLVKENEMLRNKGNEAILATQWRLRYESCLKEREDLNDKLRVFTQLSTDLNSTGKSIEQAYVELQDEFKEFRRKVIAIEKRRAETVEKLGLSMNTPNNKYDTSAFLLSPQEIGSLEMYESKGHDINFSLSKGSATSASHAAANSATSSTVSFASDNVVPSAEAPKIQYIRHMIVQYLTCKEPEVKLHIESALITLFRLSEEEKEAVLDRRKYETQDALSSITSLFGSLSTT